MTRTSMTTSMIAWHRTMLSPMTISTERERAFLFVCYRSVVFTSSAHICNAAQAQCVCAFHVIHMCMVICAFSQFHALLSAPFLLPLEPDIRGEFAQLRQREYGLLRQVLLFYRKMSSKRRIDDCWKINGSRDSSDPWTGFHTICSTRRKTS